MELAAATIRKFRIEDLPEILRIEGRGFPKSVYSKTAFLYFARSLPDTFCIGEIGGEITGYIIFDTSGHIYSMVVSPDHRRKGLGKMLVTHALEEAGSLELEVRSKNRGAIEFYSKLGMRVTGKIPGYYGNDDALVMSLCKDRESYPDQGAFCRLPIRGGGLG